MPDNTPPDSLRTKAQIVLAHHAMLRRKLAKGDSTVSEQMVKDAWDAYMRASIAAGPEMLERMKGKGDA